MTITYFCVCTRAYGWVRVCVSAERGSTYARVALLIQHATRRDIANCGLSSSPVFFYIIS